MFRFLPSENVDFVVSENSSVSRIQEAEVSSLILVMIKSEIHFYVLTNGIWFLL